MNEAAKYDEDMQDIVFQRLYYYAITNKKYKGTNPDVLINNPETYKYVKVRKFFLVRFDRMKCSKDQITEFLFHKSSGESEYPNYGYELFGLKKKPVEVVAVFKTPQPLTERDFRTVLNTITPRMLRFFNDVPK